MAKEGFDVRISLQRLLIGLILPIVPLSIIDRTKLTSGVQIRRNSKHWVQEAGGV
jgi:hypothetical protein